MSRVAIVANGTRFDWSNWQQGYAKVIACDGALHWCEHIGVSPDVVIGDGDSVSSVDLLSHHDTNQHTTDLQKALAYVHEHLPFAEVDVIGNWSESRPDHSLAVLPTLRANQVTRVVTQTSSLYFIDSTLTLELPPNTRVSLIAITKTAQVELFGLQWSGPVTLSDTTSGISNPSIEPTIRIDVQAGSEIVVCVFDHTFETLP